MYTNRRGRGLRARRCRSSQKSESAEPGGGVWVREGYEQPTGNMYACLRTICAGGRRAQAGSSAGARVDTGKPSEDS